MDIDVYKALKSLHIIFFTTWMAGLFYLPRLFVYHSQTQRATPEYNRFLEMEKKLLRYIMNPSFILTWVIGISLVYKIGHAQWLNLKIVCVFLMSAFHMYCAKIRKEFEINCNTKSEKYFRYINEIPTILFILIVIIAVFKAEI